MASDLIDTTGATNVAGWPSIKGRDVVPARRRLLLDLVPDATLQAGRDTALIGSYECYLAGRLARPRAAAPALHSGPPNAPFM